MHARGGRSSRKGGGRVPARGGILCHVSPAVPVTPRWVDVRVKQQFLTKTCSMKGLGWGEGLTPPTGSKGGRGEGLRGAGGSWGKRLLKRVLGAIRRDGVSRRDGKRFALGAGWDLERCAQPGKVEEAQRRVIRVGKVSESPLTRGKRTGTACLASQNEG